MHKHHSYRSFAWSVNNVVMFEQTRGKPTYGWDGGVIEVMVGMLYFTRNCTSPMHSNRACFQNTALLTVVSNYIQCALQSTNRSSPSFFSPCFAFVAVEASTHSFVVWWTVWLSSFLFYYSFYSVVTFVVEFVNGKPITLTTGQEANNSSRMLRFVRRTPTTLYLSLGANNKRMRSSVFDAGSVTSRAMLFTNISSLASFLLLLQSILVIFAVLIFLTL